MLSEFYRNWIFTALMVKRCSELAGRVSFEHLGLKSSAWGNCTQCVYNRSEINIPRQRASQNSVRRKGTLSDVGVRGDRGVRSAPGLSACVQHEPWLFPSIQVCVSRNGKAAVKILLEPHKLSQHFGVNAPRAALGTGGRP
jgi:hypothetical protein